jgi:hypothetical protein
MRDHGRILGGLFIAYAIAGAVSLFLVASPFGAAPAEYPKTLILVGAVLSAGYLFVGLQLRRHDPRIRIPAIIMAALALLNIPIGTALGIYALWVIFGYKQLPRKPAA